MPLLSATLRYLTITVPIQFLIILRGDDTDLVVFGSMFTMRVVNWVHVKAGCTGFTGEKAQALYEFLLQVVVQAILFAEEDDAALGN